MGDVRLLVAVESDIAKLYALGEALLRARLESTSIPPTLLFSKCTTPTIVVLTKTPISLVNVENCKKHGIPIYRCVADLQDSPAVLYRDENIWEFHFYNYFNPLMTFDKEKTDISYNQVILSLLGKLGIKNINLDGNDIMVDDRKIGSFGTRLLSQKVFTYFANVVRDFPYDFIDELYINPKHIPSQYVTTLNQELGRYVSDAEIMDGFKAFFEQFLNCRLVAGELMDLEKEIRDKAVAKYTRDDWNLKGDVIF